MKISRGISMWLAAAYALAAAVVLFPGEQIGESWGRMWKPVPTALSGENEARFFGVLAALGSGRLEVVTYGGSADDSRGSVFDETHLADYHLLPGPPIRAVSAPDPEAVPPGGSMVGYGLHPQAMSPEFREEFPFRMRCYNLRLASRVPLPEPGPVVERAGPIMGGEWRGVVGGVGVLLAMILPGLVLARLRPRFSGGWITAWAMGLFVVTCAGWWLGLFFGAGLLFVLAGLGVASLVFLLVQPRRGRFRAVWPGHEEAAGSRMNGDLWWSALCGLLAMLVGGSLVLVALSSPMFSVAGLSNWGYKAKLLYLHGAWPDGWMDRYDGPNRQAAYPPGFPLFCANYYLGVGRVADWSVRVLPPLLLALACFQSLRGLRRGGLPMTGKLTLALLGLACFLNPATVLVADGFYAEPMLGLFLVVAAAELGKAGRPGETRGSFWLALAGAAWVKPEGLVVLSVAAVLLPVWCRVAGRDWASGKRLAGHALLAAVMVVPWYLWAHAQGGGSVAGWNKERAEMMSKTLVSVIFSDWRATGILVWMILPLLYRMSRGADWRAGVFAVMAASLLLGAIARMLSSSADPLLYVEALPRIFWLPGLLCFLAVCSPNLQIRPSSP